MLACDRLCYNRLPDATPAARQVAVITITARIGCPLRSGR